MTAAGEHSAAFGILRELVQAKRKMNIGLKFARCSGIPLQMNNNVS